jgi:hypothetical protein
MSSPVCPEQDLKLFREPIKVSGIFEKKFDTCSHPLKLQDLDFSKLDDTLCRRFWKMNKNYRKFGRKWCYLFSAYTNMLPLCQRSFFTRNILNVNSDCCESCWISRLKDISNVCLQGVLYDFRLEYKIFLDLKVLGGYDTACNRESPPPYREVFGITSDQSLTDRLKFWIDDTVNKISTKQVGYSFDEFVSFRDAWATTGAAVGGKAKKVEFSTSKRDVKSLRVNTKWFSSCHLKDSEISDRCTDPDKRVIVKPFVKSDEAAALRTVQGYDMYSLIRVSYLEEAVLDFNGGGEWTSIGLDGSKKVKMSNKILMRDGFFRLCTDQSSFDQSQAKSWIVYCMQQLVARLSKSNNPDLARIGAIELQSLNNVDIFEGNSSFEWKHGILSGYRWTALLDSILNRAATRVVLERLNVKVLFEMYQGDDAIVKLNREVDLQAVSEEYSSLGLSVNPSKSWGHTLNCEYLHEIYWKGTTVYGFPARAAKSLIWDKPKVGKPSFGELKVRELLSTCLMCVRRGLDAYNVTLKIMRSLIRGLSLTKFKAWWSTPTIFGGFGGGFDGRVRLDVKEEKKKRVVMDLNFDLWSGEEYVKSAAEVRAAGVLPMPGIRRTYSLNNFKGVESMPAIEASDLASSTNIRTDWLVQDLTSFPDAYYRKLSLEWKLNKRVKIGLSDLPRPCSLLKGLDIDLIYRKYRRLIGETFSLGNWENSEVYFSHLKDFGNQVWAGICLRISVERWGFWRIGSRSTWDLDLYRRALGKLLLDFASSTSRQFIYRMCV